MVASLSPVCINSCVFTFLLSRMGIACCICTHALKCPTRLLYTIWVRADPRGLTGIVLEQAWQSCKLALVRISDSVELDPWHRSAIAWIPKFVFTCAAGIYLWDAPAKNNASSVMPSQPLRLAPSITCAATFCMWSKKFLQLAIGTSAGKVK